MSSTRTIQRYHSGSLPFAIDVYLGTYEGLDWVRQKLRGKSGWLQLSRATMVTPISTWRTTLIAARTDDGEPLNKLAASAFLAMRSSSPRELDLVPPDELDIQSEMLFWDFLGGCDLRHLRMLSEAEDERGAQVADEQARGEQVLAQADAYIADLQRQRRALGITSAARAKLTETIAFFEQKHEAAAAWLVQRLASIRDEAAALEADVLEALQNHAEVEELYTVRWTAKHPADRIYSRERPDSFFLGPNPPSRRNRTAEARLAWDRQYDDETFEDRRSRLDVVREERRRQWAAQVEERRHQDAEKQAKRAADREQFAKWAAQLKPPRKVKRIVAPTDHEQARIAQNAEQLRTAAQQTSAKRRDDKLLRDKAVAEVLRQFPTVQMLEAELDGLPSVGIENRRLARLIRIAIWRLGNGRAPVPAGEEVTP